MVPPRTWVGITLRLMNSKSEHDYVDGILIGHWKLDHRRRAFEIALVVDR